MEKTLYLTKMGGDFWDGDKRIKELSDVGNYRVETRTENIPGKDGNNYFLSFSGGYPSYTFRRHAKNDPSRTLKKPVKEVRNENTLFLSSSFENEEGAWANLKLDEEIWDLNFSYTIENILKATNLIAADTYTKIEFV